MNRIKRGVSLLLAALMIAGLFAISTKKDAYAAGDFPEIELKQGKSNAVDINNGEYVDDGRAKGILLKFEVTEPGYVSFDFSFPEMTAGIEAYWYEAEKDSASNFLYKGIGKNSSFSWYMDKGSYVIYVKSGTYHDYVTGKDYYSSFNINYNFVKIPGELKPDAIFNRLSAGFENAIGFDLEKKDTYTAFFSSYGRGDRGNRERDVFLKFENTKKRKIVIERTEYNETGSSGEPFVKKATTASDIFVYNRYGEQVGSEQIKGYDSDGKFYLYYYYELEKGTYFVCLNQYGKNTGVNRFKFYDHDAYLKYITGGSSSYSNEWVNGKWYNADGTQTYNGTLSWKSDATGWWVEDTDGWYPTSQWQKIDGKWYYFLSNGYMDYSEYREGCWLNADGSMADGYTGGHWCSDGSGWWYEDNGWYPCSQYLWIDGVQYWFGASGYWE